jgi:hypothetical protein
MKSSNAANPKKHASLNGSGNTRHNHPGKQLGRKMSNWDLIEKTVNGICNNGHQELHPLKVEDSIALCFW